VNQYESGAAVPNNQVLGKMERILGVKLRGAPGPVGGGAKKGAAKGAAKGGKKVRRTHRAAQRSAALLAPFPRCALTLELRFPSELRLN
jgi:hypothetical protein